MNYEVINGCGFCVPLKNEDRADPNYGEAVVSPEKIKKNIANKRMTHVDWQT